MATNPLHYRTPANHRVTINGAADYTLNDIEALTRMARSHGAPATAKLEFGYSNTKLTVSWNED